jgi:16S rRNA (uracil1498-N3)-methyltransferase
MGANISYSNISPSRIYCPTAINNAQELPLDQDTSHYLINVLRLKLHDSLLLFDGIGNEFLGKIIAVHKKNVIIIIQQQTSFATTSKPASITINLGQAIGKGKKLDVVIQKTTELGIHSITPILSARTIVKHNLTFLPNKQQHWDKIAIAACCQCKRNVLPIINIPLSIEAWMQQCTHGINLVLDPTATSSLAKLPSLIDNTVNILIGPEGGLSNEEVALATKFNFTAIKLGPRVMRTETAAIAIVAALQALFGDLR